VGVEESRSLTARRACPDSGIICVFVIVALLTHDLQKWRRSFQQRSDRNRPTVYQDMIVQQNIKYGTVHEVVNVPYQQQQQQQNAQQHGMPLQQNALQY
jgi:hypothetical protein